MLQQKTTQKLDNLKLCSVCGDTPHSYAEVYGSSTSQPTHQTPIIIKLDTDLIISTTLLNAF